MRLATGGVLLALVTIFLLAGVLNATAKEANTIDELVAMFDDAKCAECHEEIYKEWQQSWHAKAVISSLKGMRNFIAIGLAKEWNTELTKTQVLKCLDCHAPAVNYASEKLAVEIGGLIVKAFDDKDENAKKELAKLNVGCLSCHNIKATAVARGLRGAPEKGVVYGPNGEDGDDFHTSIETPDLSRSVFCMQCHGVYKATDGETIQCNTLSGSYQNSYISMGGSKTCQECHMKKGHFFPGGHDLETVKEGLGFDVQFAQYQHLPGKIKGVKDAKKWVPSVIVTAFVENKTGHRVPDG
jgi:nitrate/TMAO reductase-like tetraheme cytochrome c subunit